MKNKKQIVQGVVLTRTKVRNNILKVWKQAKATERHDWYNEAHAFAQSLVYGYEAPDPRYYQDLNKVIGILAATSPMKGWVQNKNVAAKIWQTGVFSGHTKAMCLKAKRIFDSSGEEAEILDILNGQKISAFFLNIRHPQRDISLTMDRHAICIALGKKHLSDCEMPALTVAQYEFFVECYRWTAAQLNITGTLLQSATWVAHRRLKKS